MLQMFHRTSPNEASATHTGRVTYYKSKDVQLLPCRVCDRATCRRKAELQKRLCWRESCCDRTESWSFAWSSIHSSTCRDDGCYDISTSLAVDRLFRGSLSLFSALFFPRGWCEEEGSWRHWWRNTAWRQSQCDCYTKVVRLSAALETGLRRSVSPVHIEPAWRKSSRPGFLQFHGSNNSARCRPSPVAWAPLSKT